MKVFSELTHFAGFDWAKDHHSAVILDRSGQVVESFEFPHSAEGWKTWQEKIAAYPQLGVAIETSRGAAIEQLLQSPVMVYPMQPKAAQRYRDRRMPSGSKTDHIDAWAFGDALRVDGQDWKPLSAQDPIVEELRLLCRDEVQLITQRTALVNQLQAALHEYYPAALEAFDDWTKPHAWALVQEFPTPQDLAGATVHRRKVFLHKHSLWRPQTAEKRLEIFARADQFCGGAPVTRAKSRLALSLVKLLQTLEKQIELYRAEIEKLFGQHPDHELFGSLPGAGKKLAPRLLSELGGNREEYPDPGRLQSVAGTAPVSFQSGQIKRARIRWDCNRSLRLTVHLWSDLSRKSCAWAAEYYTRKRQEGKSHACALRCLGQRWLKILWRMWQDRRPYDDAFHTAKRTARLKALPS